MAYQGSTPSLIPANASGVSFAPTGNVVGTNLQTAISEVDLEKLKIASNLSDLNNVDTALTNMGFTALGKTLRALADASAGRTALGSTTIGNALFTSATESAARTSILAPARPRVDNNTLEGYFQHIATNFGDNLIAPAGGTWAASWIAYGTSFTLVGGAGSNVVAGGTVLQTGIANTAYLGWWWRIA